MKKKFHKEISFYLKFEYAFFISGFFFALLHHSLNLEIFSILFQISKYGCFVVAGIILCKTLVTCERVLEQHDILMEQIEKLKENKK